MTSENFHCYICGSPEYLYMYNKPAERYLGFERSFRIVRCLQCGMVSVANQPSLDKIAKLYDETFFGTAQQQVISTAVIKNAERRVAFLRNYCNKGKLLDVGCGQGNFLSIASRIYQVIGVDISKYAVTHGREWFGLDLREGDFLGIELGGETFNIITMWDFIAHVLDPLAYLAKARQLLEPGGFIVLTTGDISSTNARLFGKYWHLMTPPKMIHYFSEPTIRLALEKCGFQQIVISWPGKYVPLDFMLTKFARMINWMWLEQKRWPKRLPQNLYVNLFDGMIVVARRDND